MTRSKVKFLCVFVCALSAGLCTVRGAPWTAAALAIAGLLVWRTHFGERVKSADMLAAIRRLREARAERAVNTAMVRATVTPQLICLPLKDTPKRWLSGSSIAFRDELSATGWRELATLLRHQPVPSGDSRRDAR